MVTEPIVKKLVGISLGFYRTIIVEEVHKIFVRIYSYLIPGMITLSVSMLQIIELLKTN